MSETFNDKIAEKLAELRAQRNAFAIKLQKELETAGFAVEVKLAEGMWGDGHLKIRHKTCKAWENIVTFDYVRQGWNRHLPVGVRAVYNMNSDGWRRKGKRFTKLDAALVNKMVEIAKLQLDGTVQAERSHAQFAADEVM